MLDRAPARLPDPALPPRRGLAEAWRRIGVWRARRRASPVWSVAVACIMALIALPIFTVLALAVAPADNIWPQLIASVLPAALFNTLVLMTLTGLATLVTGAATAWLVTMYRFPGRVLADRLLVLPLSIPGYIAAYVYGDLLAYSGPLQAGLRSAFGLPPGTPALIPDVRSLWGAIFVLASVLYPYVYLSARASFVQQSVCALEVARTLGRTPMGVFWAVALPMARPALVAGVALVMMECLADLAAVQYLGVPTLTASIYATWLQRSNLGGAAQLATVLIGVVGVVFFVEAWARGGAQTHTTGRYRSIPFHELEGWKGWAATAACLLPFIVGFAVPVAVLTLNAATHLAPAFEAGFWPAVRNSVVLAACSATAAVLVALVLAYARRVAPNGLTRPAARIAGLGYAVPGTVLAIGLLIPLGALDNRIDAFARSAFGVSTGLLLTGSLLALTFAYVIRFLAVALGALEGGLSRISPNLDAAARALGETPLSVLYRVHLPLLTPALASGCLLVFVDAMKELPATLLMRPFNFETLATHVYSLATIEQFEAAAPGSLMIVIAGLLPVLALHRAIAAGRSGGQ
jgi:iron(III) transport system permease protein